MNDRFEKKGFVRQITSENKVVKPLSP